MNFFSIVTFFIFFWTTQLCNASVIGISTINNLSFGKLATGTGGSVTISTTGQRSKSGGVVLLSSETGSAAHFCVIGDRDLAVFISLPSNGDVSLSSGTQSIPVINFTVTPGTSGLLDNNGIQMLAVGGTLNIEGRRQAGNYSGTFNITVNYQ